MLRAMIFDMDGTLLQTEKLKALSYARAAVSLCPYSLNEDEVIEAFKEVVGRSRKEVATYLVDKFNLSEKTYHAMDVHSVSTNWQAFVQVRLQIYNTMLDDPQILKNHQWKHNVGLLNIAREMGCKTALATMSHREQVRRILEILGWHDKFDFIATRDDVEHSKPNPEIYHLVREELAVDVSECLVIEDSPAGVEAALRANMNVIAVSTPFTKDRLRDVEGLDSRWIVDDHETLLDVVRECVDLMT